MHVQSGMTGGMITMMVRQTSIEVCSAMLDCHLISCVQGEFSRTQFRQKLSRKVRLVGHLPYDQMPLWWKVLALNRTISTVCYSLGKLSSKKPISMPIPQNQYRFGLSPGILVFFGSKLFD